MTINETLFKISADHLLKQNERSADVGSTDKTVCFYRGRNGLKCAIGVLVNDENYSPELEGYGIAFGGIIDPICATHGIDNREDIDLRMLFSLQNIHDNYEPREWRELLLAAAARFYYDWKPTEEISE
jgi:hypothetical protein